MTATVKQLICPECGQMMATAVWGLFRGLRITSPDGFPVTPVSDDLLNGTPDNEGDPQGSERPGIPGLTRSPR